LRRIEACDINNMSNEELGSSYLPIDDNETMAFPNNMETQLRGLGMPTLLKSGEAVSDVQYRRYSPKT
jgi:hypothetical protein